MKCTVTPSTVVMCLATGFAVAGFIQEVRGVELLEAPSIIVGRVTTVSQTGRAVIYRGGRIEVDQFAATVSVQRVVRGPNASPTFALENLAKPRNPNTHLARQFVEVDRVYVFFLVPGERQGVFRGVNATEFALEVESLPDDQKEARLPIDQLRRIAKVNIGTAREGLAARWFAFLGGQYRSDEDFQFCMGKLEDTRLRVRGSALCILCEREPTAPLLYSRCMSFLDEVSDIEGLWKWRRRISKCLPRTLGDDGVTRDTLRKWLGGRVRELQEVAVERVMKTRDALMADAVVELMARTTNRQTQYDCIKALSAVRGSSGPSFKKFMEEPDEYVKQWKE